MTRPLLVQMGTLLATVLRLLIDSPCSRHGADATSDVALGPGVPFTDTTIHDCGRTNVSHK